MPEMILNLPLGRRASRSAYHDLFTAVSDGKAYKIARSEFAKDDPKQFRNRLQTWARTRKLEAATRVDSEGNLYVQMTKQPGYVESE